MNNKIDVVTTIRGLGSKFRKWGYTLKSIWLEIIFGIFIIIAIVLSITNSVKYIPIDHGKHLQNSDIEMGNISLNEYLKKIRTMDCTAIIAVKDIQGHYIDSNTIDELSALGFLDVSVLLNEEYHSFIGIYSAGKAVFQQIGGDEAISHVDFIKNHYITTKSATWNSGNVADIYVDDVQYSVNNRGFNIVVIDNTTDKLIDSVSYDVYAEDVPIYRLIDGNLTWIASTREKDNE